MDTDDQAERRGLEIMRDAGTRLVAGVEAAIPRWAVRVVQARVKQWSGVDPSEVTMAAAREAGVAAATRVARELTALLALDPDEQAATPLEIVRSAVREVTDVLQQAHVPHVVRDDFAERAWPHDVYGLVPHTLADLGDDELAPLHVAWGVGKATAIRARRQAAPGPDQDNHSS